MLLTEHFLEQEFLHSNTANAKGYHNNWDSEQHKKNAINLCKYILEPLRKVVNAIKILSGYRGKRLNADIGGVSSSQHCKGEAADIEAVNFDLKKMFNLIIDLKLPFDQLIYENPPGKKPWIHVSYSGRHRRQILYFNGKTYKPIKRM